MTRTLYVLATSPRPDPYINAIAYAISHLQAKAISILVVTEHDYDTNDGEVDSASTTSTIVMQNIISQLTRLSEGSYRNFLEVDNQTEGALSDRDVEVYRRCLKAINESGASTRSVRLVELGSLLSKIAGEDSIVDVTGLKNNLLVEVTVGLFSFGFKDIYSFELKPGSPLGGSEALYHALIEDESYIYRKLGSGELAKSSILRLRRWAARSKVVLALVCLLAIGLFVANVSDCEIVSTSIQGAGAIASIVSLLYVFIHERERM